ncbi:MAG: hypothetical protein Q7S57_03775 [bacterium]|nr:hypothetical protein [bacterium]
MITAELREWLCVSGHIFFHKGAIPDAGADILEIAQAAEINARVCCPCGAVSMMEFPLGEISRGDVYPLVRCESVVVPAGQYFDAEGERFEEGSTAILEVRNIDTLLSALELSEEP